MKIVIKNRWSDAVIFECDADSIREACEKATVANVSLRSADLSSADLSSANLSLANLSLADLSLANLRSADLRSADLRLANLRSADLRSADLRSADLRLANLRSADLSSADLSLADLRLADLRSADLSLADLRSANLSLANLESVRVDFFDVLLRASTNGEVPFLIAALKSGQVDGSTYEGECSCLVGTIGRAKDCKYTDIPDLKPDSSRPAERFFLAIRKGDKPETNGAAKIALEWAEEFQRLMARARGHQ